MPLTPRHLLLLALLCAWGPFSAGANAPVDSCKLALIHSHLAYESVTVEGLVHDVPAPLITRTQFLEALAPLGFHANHLVLAALAQAEQSHVSQPRRDGGSYLEQHVMPVALSALREWQYNPAVQADISAPNIIMAALLHDVLEDDASLNVDLIASRFGAEVASVVGVLTKPVITLESFAKLRAKWFKNFIYVSRLGRSRPAAIAVKMADRMNNIISTLALLQQNGVGAAAGSGYAGLSDEARTAVFYVLETHEFYEPLALRFSYHYYLRLRFVLDRIRGELSAAGPWESIESQLRHFILRGPLNP